MVRFEALAFLPWTFPNKMKFKCWCSYAPSSLGLTTASTHLLTYGLGSVLCPTTVQTVSPPSAQSPFAQSGCNPPWGDAPSVSSEDIAPPFSLLRTHSPVSASSPLLRFCLVGGVFAGLSTSPCCPPDLPDVISEDLSCDAWAPITTVCRLHVPVSSSATAAFPTRKWVGFTVNFRLSDFTAVGIFEIAAISLCSGLTFCSPLWSLLPPQFPAGQLVTFTSGQNVLRYLRTHRIC